MTSLTQKIKELRAACKGYPTEYLTHVFIGDILDSLALAVETLELFSNNGYLYQSAEQAKACLTEITRKLGASE